MNLFAKELLAVEVAGDEIRAALVRGTARTREIIDFVSMKNSSPDDDLPSVEAVKALAERLRRSGGPAVFVTAMARAFELRMDRGKVSSLKARQLREAVRWEAEPYTGITGANALIGVQAAPRPKSRPGEIVYEDEDDQTAITVTALERNVYRAVKERFRVAGFSLRRVYPPDVTFYMPLLLDSMDVPRAILEVGRDYSNFAIVRGRAPEQISTLTMSLESISGHLSGEMVSPELEDSLRFMARQVPGPEALVVSGCGAADPGVLSYISGFCANGARPLLMSRGSAISDARAEAEHAVFGTVVGAAVRELIGRGGRELGIDDSVAMGQRLKKSAYLFPVAVTALAISLLFGHYGYMRYQEASYKKRIEKLKDEVKERKARVADYEQLIKQEEAVRKEISVARRRLDFITNRSDKDVSGIIAAIRGIGGAVSDRVVLSSIARESGGDYLVIGGAAGQGAVGRFMAALQRQRWCASAILKKAERGEADKAFLRFEISVKSAGPAS